MEERIRKVHEDIWGVKDTSTILIVVVVHKCILMPKFVKLHFKYV